jgi:hypothetical protein
MYGIVEIMGHRTRAGVLSDATIGGAIMLRIEHPSLCDHTGTEPLTEYYAPAAIFAIRPCSREEAVVAAEWWKRTEPMRELSADFDDVIDDYAFDDPDDDPVRGGP